MSVIAARISRCHCPVDRRDGLRRHCRSGDHRTSSHKCIRYWRRYRPRHRHTATVVGEVNRYTGCAVNIVDRIIAAIAAIEEISASPACKTSLPSPANQNVVAIITEKRVSSRTAVDGVIAGSTGDIVALPSPPSTLSLPSPPSRISSRHRHSACHCPRRPELYRVVTTGERVIAIATVDQSAPSPP
ncbi:MAG: hypothetical protein R3D29_16495 [Nitratireductor sp.]